MRRQKSIILRAGALSAFCLAGLIANACTNFKDARAEDQAAINQKNTKNPLAKNVILFVGDGMGISTVTAARIFDGQSQGKLGEEHVLSFEEFDDIALIKTYNTNAQVPDSAGTATAIMSGYKTKIGTINVEPDKELSGCGDIPAKPTLSDIASGAGKSVGIISTARITHATPAAMFGHADYRGWEADRDLPEQIKPFGCKSLAAQLVDPATPVDIALGGGLNEFSDAQLLEWADQDADHIVVKTGAEFKALSPGDTQSVLGLFDESHMDYEADRLQKGDEPSLAEMTSFAIDNLSARGTNGYVLMVEAGRVDHAHHGTNAYRAMRDMQALNEAVKTAVAKTSSDDTLILVTADHSHVFTIAGYPVRGNPILGLVRSHDRQTGDPKTEPELAEDGKPYTTLGYQNGSGDVRGDDVPALTDNMVQAPNFKQQVAVPLGSETHAGEDVPLYASGPGAHRVGGVMEQDEIHDVMIKAMGLD